MAEGEFITEYKNEFIVKFNNEIIGRKYIKPYEDKIKVGDWMKHNDQVFKVNGKELSSFLLECTKITNPQLIELLEKSINE